VYFKFPCGHCGKSLKVKEESVGRKARCPYCRTAQVVPSPSQEVLAPGSAAIPVARRRAESPAPATTRSASPAAARPRPQSAPTEGGGDSSNVSLLTSGLLGVIFGAVFYIGILPIRESGFGELFFDRDWVPFVLVFLVGWSAGTLVLKYRLLRRQRESLLFDLLPSDISEEITENNTEAFIDHIRQIPARPSESFLITRVLRGLEHFLIRKSHAEVAGLLNSQSEIDGNTVDSSYRLLGVFIWAIPILGFIGTVMGISAAVGGFSQEMAEAADIAALKDKLGTVTKGLGVAFDTTLIALIMSLLVMFPTSTMQKAEEDLLNGIDEYCNENLLKRLTESDAHGLGSGNYRADIRQAVDAAIAGNSGSLLEQMDAMQARMASLQDGQLQQFEQLSQTVDSGTSAVDQKMLELTDRADGAQKQLGQTLQDAAEQIRTHFTAVERGMDSLNSVLERLGEKRVVIEMKKPARSLWPFGRRSAGNGDPDGADHG